MYPLLFLSTFKWSVQLFASPDKTYQGLFYRVIAAITKWMATHNPPHGLECTPNDTMAFDSINGILGTGGRKTAGRGKQWGNQELICPDQGKKKMSAAFLQKIFHKFIFSCISSSRSLDPSGYKLNGIIASL
jgi:hypothetical protein